MFLFLLEDLTNRQLYLFFKKMLLDDKVEAATDPGVHSRHPTPEPPASKKRRAPTPEPSRPSVSPLFLASVFSR